MTKSNGNKCLVDKYYKSSCNCHNCTRKKYREPAGNPTNMSVRGCNFSQYYNCYDENFFRSNIEPRYKTGYESINPEVIQDKYAKNFALISENKSRLPKSCENAYISSDPRLISASHNGQVLALDRPPIDSTVCLDDLNNENLKEYGKNYNTYSDINAGQIEYYIDKSRSDPFFNPLFTIPSKSIGKVYKDPMGSMKPQYNRHSLVCNSMLDTTNDNYSGGLSWIQDSTSHREDLLSLQMRKRNEQRWMPRWT
jgi:hypothetical protein